MDYHNQTNFGAFDALVQAIIDATPAQLEQAIKGCAIIARNQSFKPARRLLFKGFANLLRLYHRKYVTVPKQLASKAEQRRIAHQNRSG